MNDPKDLVALTIFTPSGSFLTVPVMRGNGEMILRNWSEGKYKDKPCQGCNGKGTVFIAQPDKQAADQKCPQCGGDGLDEFVIRSECPPGVMVREWAFKPNKVIMMHIQEYPKEVLQQQGQNPFNPSSPFPGMSGPQQRN